MYDVGCRYWLFAQLRAVLVLSHGVEPSVGDWLLRSGKTIEERIEMDA
jgi:hypothetical protein